MEVSRLTIPRGVAGTDATVKIMRRMIEQGRRDVGVRKLAEQIIHNNRVREYNYVGELIALHSWVRSRIRYTKDPVDVEYIQTPRETLSSGVGDCDDFTVLLGSLAESIGHPVAIKVVSRNRNRNFHHVYPIADVGGKQIGLDASMPFPFGYEDPAIVKSKIYPSGGVNGNMRTKNVFEGVGKMIRPAGGDGATTGVPIIIASDVIVPKKPLVVPDQPVIALRPPEIEERVVADKPVIYLKPPTNGGPVVYLKPPTNGGPVVYPKPPTNGTVTVTPGGTTVTIAETPGPLGLPWIAWIGIGVAAVFLFKK